MRPHHFPRLVQKTIRLKRTKIHHSRRSFLKSIAFTTASAILSHLFFSKKQVLSDQQPRIVIIGGGLAGLNAAYQLKKAGFTATLYEASERLGGRVFSVQGKLGEGLVTNLGGSFINSDHEDMLSLAKEFNLKLLDRQAHIKSDPIPQVRYCAGNQFILEKELAEKLEPLAKQIAQDAALVEKDYDKFAPYFDQLSVQDYLEQHRDKISDALARTFVENTIRSEYGVEPEESSALQLLYVLPTVENDTVELLGRSDERFMIEGGNEQLAKSLANALSGQIKMRMPLVELEKKVNSYALTFQDKSSVEADWVILAIPFTILRTLKLKVDLPEKLQRFIQEVSLGHNEKLIAGFPTQFWRQKNGFSQEMWTDLGFCEVWTENLDLIPTKQGALTFFFGGNEVKKMQSEKTNLLSNRLVSQLGGCISGVQQADDRKVLKTAWTNNPWSRGAYTNFKPGQLTTFHEFFYVESDDLSQRQQVNVGNLVLAGEHLSDGFYGYMNGAAQTGRLAASLIIRELQSTPVP